MPTPPFLMELSGCEAGRFLLFSHANLSENSRARISAIGA
jgi:hypothetical protein